MKHEKEVYIGRGRTKQKPPVVQIFVLLLLCAGIVFFGLIYTKNAQSVKELKKQLESLQSYVDELPRTIAKTESKIAELTAEQERLSSEAASVETEKKAEEYQIAQLEKLIKNRQKMLDETQNH